MLAKDSVKTRLDGGLSFTEFSYMLLQSYDFLMLRKLHGVELQMGGSDQWGNITAGTELIRRTEGESAEGAPHAFGLCYPLLLAKSGAKFGKTAEGAVWLDPARTSPFAFRQFWMEQDDESLTSLLHRFSLDSVAETASLMARHAENPAARRAQRHLAQSVTSMVHGADVEARAATVADALFGDGEGGTPDPRALTPEALSMLAGELPTSGLPSAADATLIDLVIAAGFVTSKSEARRLVEQGGVSVNGAPAPDLTAAVASFAPLADGSLLLRKGRRDYRLLRRA